MAEQSIPDPTRNGMDAQRWSAVEAIFHVAVELEPGERDEFVERESAGDALIAAEALRLLRADEESDSLLDTPAALWNQPAESSFGPPPLAGGDLVQKRFQILRSVGEGGMGHVYEALDLELHVPVALKTIRPEILSLAGALDLFRREVRTARRITHAHVCRIYDLDRGQVQGKPELGELHFITMEFLEGETLAARLRRAGPMEQGMVLELVRQLADGLECAHGVGVIHRDIKPANIMLVEQAGQPFRAVLMDFGLARLDPRHGASASTPSLGSLAGTLAYMAPEQMDPTAVLSAATDLYAFGLVIYEALTGQTAFGASGTLSSLARRMQEPSPSPSKLVPGLDPAWERAIGGCLHLAPEDRLQSAGAVVRAIEASPGVRPADRSGEPPASRQRLPWLHRRHVVWIALGATVVAVSLLVILVLSLRLLRREEKAPIATGALVYLAPVRNLTRQPELNDVTELLRAGLGQSPQLTLLDSARVGDTLQRMTRSPESAIDEPLAREIAMRNDAVRVVFVTVTGGAGSYRMTVDVEQPDNTPARFRQHWVKSFEWQMTESEAGSGSIPAGLSVAVRTASNWVRAQAGEAADDIARLDAPPEDVTTASWPALAEYARAERFRTSLRYEEAIESYQAATHHDSSFALAYAREGDVLLQTNRFTEGYKAYDRALELANDQRLDLRERDRIAGDSALDMWNSQGAEVAFRDSLLYYPNDYAAHCYLAYALEGLGQVEQAIAELKLAYAIDPNRPAAPEHLVRYALLLGDLSSARGWNEAITRTAGNEHRAWAVALEEFSAGNYDEARRNMLAMTHSSGPMLRASGYDLLARLAAEQGDLAGAHQWTEEALADDRPTGDRAAEAGHLLDQAADELLAGSVGPAIADMQKALALDRGPQNQLDAAEMLGNAAENARGNDLSAIRAALDELGWGAPPADRSVVSQVVRLHVEGESLLARGESVRALSLFRQAAAIEPANWNRSGHTRAARSAATREPEPGQRKKLLREAYDACSEDVLPVRARWQWFYRAPLGAYELQMERFVQLAGQLKLDDGNVRGVEQALSQLRKGAAGAGPGPHEAR